MCLTKINRSKEVLKNKFSVCTVSKGLCRKGGGREREGNGEGTGTGALTFFLMLYIYIYIYIYCFLGFFSLACQIVPQYLYSKYSTKDEKFGENVTQKPMVHSKNAV